MAVEGSSFELGVVTDPRALRAFLSELEVVPAALKRISQAINSVDLGDGRKFAGDGKKVAEAFIQAARAELSGTSFQRAFREAMSGVDLRIPPEAQAHLRSDLERINAEIRRALPQQVQIGVRANTSGQALREAAPQAFRPIATASSQADVQRSLSEIRAEARALRASAREPELGTTRGRSGGASAQELLKAADLVDRTSDRYQAAASRLADATDKGARTLERVAVREETRAAAEGGFTGGPDRREGALARATETARTQRALRQLGLEGGGLHGLEGLQALQEASGSGETEAITPFRKFVAGQARKGQTSTDSEAARAEKEANAARTRAARQEQRDREKAAADQKKADEVRAKAASDEAERARLLDRTNQSDAGFLARAQATASKRRIAAQKAIETTSFAPNDFESLIEDSNALRLKGQARAQQLRDRGAAGKIGAGVLGTSGVSFLERQASIISTTASFAVGGQLFQGVLSGLTEIVSGTRQFEEALSHLSVTFGDSTNNLRGFATEVGAQANAVGLTQAQGVEAASKSVGLFNTNNLSEQDKEDFAKLAVGVTGRIAQQGGTQDLSGVETNLAGILRSFQLQNADLTRVEDSIAVIAKQTGGNQAEILQAASETATLARSAGFDAFQNSAIIANQATTTGQTAGTAAEQLAQVFAQASNAAVAAKFNSLGIDTNSTLASQFQQLSGKVQSGAISQDEFSSISALFGRSRSGAAFRNLIEQFPRINGLADEARNSPGEGQKQFEEIFGNINGIIIKTVGSLKNLATELAQSGLLDVLGLLVISVGQVANALTEVLHLFNGIDRPIRTAALALGEFLVAARLLGGTRIGASVLASAIGGAGRVGAGGLAARLLGSGAAEAAAVRSAAPLVAAPGLLAGGGGAVAALLTNPATIAAVAAISAIIISQKITDANDSALRSEDRASTASGNARTAEDLRSAASARRQAAQDEDGRRNAGLKLGNVVDFFTGHDAARNAERDRGLADSLDARAKVVEGAQAGEKQKTAELFGRFNSADEVSAQLQRLQAEGYTAAQRVAFLSDAFGKIASTADKAGVAVLHAGSSGVFGQGVGASLTGAIASGASQADMRSQAADFLQGLNPFTKGLASTVDTILTPFGQSGPTDRDTADKFRDLATKLQGTDTAKLQTNVSDSIQQVLQSRHIDTSKGDQVLSQDDIGAIKKAADDQLEAFITANIPSGAEFDEVRRIIRNSFKVNLDQQIKQFTSGVATTPDQAINFLNATFAESNTAFQETSFRDKSGASATRVKTQKEALDKAKTTLSGFGNDEGDKSARNDALTKLQEAQIAYDQSVADDAKVQLEKTTALINLRQSRRGRLDTAGRLGDQLDAANQALKTAKQTGDPTDIANAQTAVDNIVSQQQQLALDTAASVANSKIDPRNTGALAAQAVANAQKALNDAKAHGDKKAVADATIALGQANVQNLQTQVSIANARRNSKVPVGDDVAAATAALANARDELKGELVGTQAYYDTLAQIKQLEKNGADTRLARINNQRLLRIDLTDPVAEATAARQAAQDTLRNAKGPDARDRARLDLRQKQAAEEAQKFQQRLSDVQTADQLGRISHQQYISYLQSEHDRLSAIKVKTRQQTDELNQVDLLMKQTANEFNGQFNLGDIKLPTVYEVRRAIKAGVGGILGANNGFAGAGVGQVVTDNSQRTLIVQGVSIDEVMKRIYALYGGKPVRTTTTRKR